MKIIYIDDFFFDENNLKFNTDENFIILKYDRWNDYGYRTYFHLSMRYEKKLYAIGGIRILFEDEVNSYSEIRNMEHILEDKYRIIEKFNSDKKYISLGASAKFYQLLKELLPDEVLYDVLYTLHELCYLERKNQIKDIELKSTEGFNESLTRDTDSKKSVQEASHILFGEDLDEDRFKFDFTFQLNSFDDEHKISFDFNDEFFPANIITFVGKNGTGKTQTLKHLSECLQMVGVASKENRKNLLYDVKNAFSHEPPFSKVVVISYSPFEDFYNQEDIKSFSYSGLRNKDGNISKDIVFKDMKKSVTKMIKDDIDAFEFNSTILKIQKLYEILKIAIPNLNKIGMEINSQFIQNFNTYNSNKKIEVVDNIIILPKYTKEELKTYSHQDIINLKVPFETIDKIKFLDNENKEVGLSSGQEIFTYMIFSILGKIEEESLLIFDEPESYLHPNLEVVFMRLLKEILKVFNSYCILATHSLIITRETPSKFVRVFSVNDKIPLIRKPSSIETFGSNLNTICNNVFDNLMEDKPFEDWLITKIRKDQTIKIILEEFGDRLNPETLMYIRNEILDD